MWIEKLALTNFRSYESREICFEKFTTVLVGANAIGKTNILEAIYLLATGESFRAEKIEEMVRWGEEVAHVLGKIIFHDGQTELNAVLTSGQVQGKKTIKRAYKVNGVNRRKLDFVGQLTAVVFRPEDLEIITDSPTLRRSFLDKVLSQVDREYRRSLLSYEKGLRRRNKLLTQIREGEVPRTVLKFWDMLLVKEGEVLTRKRQELVEYINGQPEIEQTRRVEYDFSVISEKRLKQYEREEVLAGHTLVGPHRDDFKILTSVERDLAIYGSRGEQRMGVLWLKLCELAFVEERVGVRPVLLLDDIFSELDDKHDQMVMDLLGKQQTIITTTDLDQRLEGIDELEIIQLNSTGDL